jgi:succinate dehydrogenase hydrophobic membrane anchor protein
VTLLAGTGFYLAGRVAPKPPPEPGAVAISPGALLATGFADLEGRSQTLAAYAGRVVVLNFWATWCAPCREEMPEFVAAYDRYQDDGLVIVGVNAQETASQAAGFMDNFNMTFPVALDARGDVQQLYNVRGLPTTVFIDREGRVAERWAGLFAAPWMKVATALALAALFYHAWVGMRDLWMDYVKPVGVRLALQVFTMVWLVACAGWAVQVLWRL